MDVARPDPGPAAPISGGAFVAVVGPSGAGKDTLILYARDILSGEPRATFVRRVITRPCDGSTEDHDTLDEPAFARALAAGGFAVSWDAHGLRYGLPASVDRAIAAGSVAVANVSRDAIAGLRARYANVTVVEISLPRELLSARLAARGRESSGEVSARLARTAGRFEPHAIVVDNSGPRHVAGNRLVSVIRGLLA